MKRILWLLLLLSVGLNLGLGWRLVTSDDGASETVAADSWRSGERRGGPHNPDRKGWGDRGGRSGERPDPADSAGWTEVMDMRMERLTRRLELSEAQQTVFRAAQTEASTAFGQLRQRVEVAQGALFSLAEADGVSTAEFRVAAAELSQCRASLDSLVSETMLKEMSTLDSNQRKRYLEHIPWSRMGMGPGGRPDAMRPGFRPDQGRPRGE